MKRPFLLLLCLLGATSLRADEQVRALQGELKDQGFYYGEIDGTPGPGFSSALRRYQIRNGLEVTGAINPETLGALRANPGSAPAAETPAPTAPVQRAPATAAPVLPPRVDLRKKQSVVESDERALREETARPVQRLPRDPSIVAPPADLYSPYPPQSNPRYRDVYAGGPFAAAPPQLQEQTLRAAQRRLSQEGFYDGPADGQPGPGTQDALLAYQHTHALPRSGRLDLDTLSSMHLLPGSNSANPVLKPFTAPPRNSSRVYRGVWVN